MLKSILSGLSFWLKIAFLWCKKDEQWNKNLLRKLVFTLLRIAGCVWRRYQTAKAEWRKINLITVLIHTSFFVWFMKNFFVLFMKDVYCVTNSINFNDKNPGNFHLSVDFVTKVLCDILWLFMLGLYNKD